MAKTPKPTPTTGTGGDPAAAATTTAKRTKRATNPDEQISWTTDGGAKDTAIINMIIESPGALTTRQIRATLVKMFPNEAPLQLDNAPEKIRQRVRKLSERSVELGFAELSLKRMNNSGYDYGDTIAAVFQARTQQQAQTTAPAAPVSTAPAPLLGGSGLIPTPVTG